MKQLTYFIFFLIILSFSFCKDSSHSGKTGWEVKKPWIRLVPPSSKVTGGYMTIVNHGPDDRLVSASSLISETMEIHEMTEKDGMMKMRKLENGIELKSHKQVVLKPGGNHLMFIGLNKELKEGDKISVSLELEKAGKKEIEFTVGEKKTHDHNDGNHEHHKENHKHHKNSHNHDENHEHDKNSHNHDENHEHDKNSHNHDENHEHDKHH